MTKKIKKAVPIEIEYTNIQGENSTRTILPNCTPTSNVSALDISALSDCDANKLQVIFEEYQQYRDLQLSVIFTLEDFIDQQYPNDTKFDYKWRSFKWDSIKIK